MIRIAITGPESSGKTTLAESLSEALNAVLVPEFARSYLRERKGSYRYEDLLKIARKQCEMEDSTNKQALFMVSDTDLTVIKIWSEEKFKRCHPWIKAEMNRRTYDFVILCSPDIPWAADPLRENPEDRNRLYELYKRSLDDRNLNYIILKNDPDKRLKMALDFILQ